MFASGVILFASMRITVRTEVDTDVFYLTQLFSIVVVSLPSPDTQTIMKLIITLLSTMLFLGLAQAGQGKNGKHHKPAAEAGVEKKISKEDFLKKAKNADRAAKKFDKLDKNADGFLTRDEFKKPKHKHCKKGSGKNGKKGAGK
jgi:hypothetical protein